MTVFLTLFAVCLLYFIQARYYKKHWTNGLDTQILFQDPAINEGEISAIQEIITNRKALPLTTLQVKFTVSKRLQFTDTENTATTDQNYRNDIFSVMPYEKITRNLQFTGLKRGYYQIKELDLISYDLFLSQKSILPRENKCALYVYPKPADYQTLLIPFRKMMGTILTRRSVFEDPFEFRGIRPYEPYDSLKDVNWKASARTGTLKVNMHNYTASQQVTILLNLFEDSNWHSGLLLEESIRIAASYSELLIGKGIPVRLVSNGIDALSDQEFVLPAGAGPHHIQTLKEGLARISENSNSFPPMDAALEKELLSSDNSDLYILISHSQKEHALQLYDQLCLKSRGSQWIAPLLSDMEFLTARCPHADAIKWEVSYE